MVGVGWVFVLMAPNQHCFFRHSFMQITMVGDPQMPQKLVKIEQKMGKFQQMHSGQKVPKKSTFKIFFRASKSAKNLNLRL